MNCTEENRDKIIETIKAINDSRVRKAIGRTDGIEGIAGFWDNGIRYFKIASPTGKQFEFCQIL